MGHAQQQSNFYGGRYVRSNWKIVDGQKVGVVPAHGKTDLISSAYVNSDGTRVVYGIPLDLDADRAQNKWKDAEGRLDWDLISSSLETTLPVVHRYIGAVSRSSGGKGLAVFIGIKPLPMIESTKKNQEVASRLQHRLIEAFSELGIGADFGALGLVREMRNFQDPSAQILYRPDLLRDLEASQDVKHFGLLLGELESYLRKVEASSRLYNDERIEGALARLFLHLFGGSYPSYILPKLPQESMSGYIEVTVMELSLALGLSRAFLRKFLKVPPHWLFSLKIPGGWRLCLHPSYCCEFEARALALVQGSASRRCWNIEPLVDPEDVCDGMRNVWLTRACLYLKWCGIQEFEALYKLRIRAVHMSDHETSRNVRNLESIVSSIYGNRQELFGVFTESSLPPMLVDDSRYEDRASQGCVIPIGRAASGGTRPVELLTASIAHEEVQAPEAPLMIDECHQDTSIPVAAQGASERALESIKTSGLGLVLPMESSLLEMPISASSEIGSPKEVLMELQVRGAEEFDGPFFLPGFFPSQNKNDVSLQKGLLGPGVIPSEFRERVGIVGSDGHVGVLGVRYSVDVSEIGKKVKISLEKTFQGLSILHIFDLLTGCPLVTHEVPAHPRVKRVTKSEHRFFPKQVGVRQDGHVCYFGKLYSVGPRFVGRKVDVLMVGGQILIKFEGDLLEVHDSIQGTKKKSLTKPEHMGPWFEAQHHDSYFRRRGRQFGESVDQFILSLIKNTPGVVPSSKLFCLLRMGKEFGPAHLAAACGKQLERGDFLIRSLRRELEG